MIFKVSNFQGKKIRVTINPVQKESPSFQEKVLDDFMVDNNQMVRNMRKTCALIRNGEGRYSVPKDYAQHVSEKANFLENYYKTDKIEFEVMDVVKET